MGHWITDTILIRWAELTSRNVAGLSISQVFDRLMVRTESRRQDLRVREFYRGVAKERGLRSAWSGRQLPAEFDVDHIIPFTLRRDSSMWNLVPATTRENRSKRDKLHTIERIRRSEERIIDAWRTLYRWNEPRFHADAVRLQPAITSAHRWEEPLLAALIETVETATLRGVERWAG